MDQTVLPLTDGVNIAARRGGKDLDGEDLEAAVDEDLKEFEKFFRSLGNDSLSGPERAAIKTYLWWKTHPEDPRVKNARIQD